MIATSQLAFVSRQHTALLLRRHSPFGLFSVDGEAAAWAIGSSNSGAVPSLLSLGTRAALPSVPASCSTAAPYQCSRHAAMSAEGSGTALELRTRRGTSSRMQAASDPLPGTNSRFDSLELHPALADKAEARLAYTILPTTPSPLPHPHTNASTITSSDTSASASNSELTSSSSPSGGSLPANKSAGGGRQRSSTTKQQSKNPRRPKSQTHQHHPQWSKQTASSDDTGSESRTSQSSSTRASTNNAAPSPRTSWGSQKKHSYSNRASSKTAGNTSPLMAANFGAPSGSLRGGVSSPRPKGRGTSAGRSYCASPL